MDYLTAVTAGAGLLMLGALMVLTAHLVHSDELPPNSAIGLRTNATKASNAAWRAGHQAALPLLRATGGAGLVMGVVPSTCVLAAQHLRPSAASAAGAVASGLGYVIVIGLTVWAAVVADRAARAVGAGSTAG